MRFYGNLEQLDGFLAKIRSYRSFSQENCKEIFLKQFSLREKQQLNKCSPLKNLFFGLSMILVSFTFPRAFLKDLHQRGRLRRQNC